MPVSPSLDLPCSLRYKSEEASGNKEEILLVGKYRRPKLPSHRAKTSSASTGPTSNKRRRVVGCRVISSTYSQRHGERRQLRAGFERNGLRTVLDDWLALSFCIIVVVLWTTVLAPRRFNSISQQPIQLRLKRIDQNRPKETSGGGVARAAEAGPGSGAQFRRLPATPVEDRK